MVYMMLMLIVLFRDQPKEPACAELVCILLVVGTDGEHARHH